MNVHTISSNIWPVAEITFKKYLMIFSQYLLQPLGNTLPNAARDLVSLLSSKGTLLARVQLGVHRDSPVPSCRAAFQMGSHLHVLIPGLLCPQVQDFALLLIEFHEVPISPLLRPFRICLEAVVYQVLLPVLSSANM